MQLPETLGIILVVWLSMPKSEGGHKIESMRPLGSGIHVCRQHWRYENCKNTTCVWYLSINMTSKIPCRFVEITRNPLRPTDLPSFPSRKWSFHQESILNHITFHFRGNSQQRSKFAWIPYSYYWGPRIKVHPYDELQSFFHLLSLWDATSCKLDGHYIFRGLLSS